MDALIKYIVEQWAVLMTAPSAFVAVLALGGLIGWAAAWIILKQRLDRYKERTEPGSKPDTGKAKRKSYSSFI